MISVSSFRIPVYMELRIERRAFGLMECSSTSLSRLSAKWYSSNILAKYCDAAANTHLCTGKTSFSALKTTSQKRVSFLCRSRASIIFSLFRAASVYSPERVIFPDDRKLSNCVRVRVSLCLSCSFVVVY